MSPADVVCSANPLPRIPFPPVIGHHIPATARYHRRRRSSKDRRRTKKSYFKHEGRYGNRKIEGHDAGRTWRRSAFRLSRRRHRCIPIYPIPIARGNPTCPLPPIRDGKIHLTESFPGAVGLAAGREDVGEGGTRNASHGENRESFQNPIDVVFVFPIFDCRL